MSLININELNLTKDNIKSASDKVVTKVKAGEADPLRVYLIAKAYKKLAEDVISKIESEAFVELEKYKKNERVFGCKATITNGGVILDYDADSEYNRLKNELDKRKKLLDEANKIGASGGIVVDEDGAIIEPIPIKTYKKNTITVNF